MQIVKNVGPTTLTKTWYVDGTATDVGDVTIGITDWAGNVVVAAATATTNNADGTYTYSLATQTAVDRLTVTWTRDDTSAALIDTVEVVGFHLFTEFAARNHGRKLDETAPLATEAEYSDGWIQEERERITDLLEHWTAVSWAPRYHRETLAGTGSQSLQLARREVTEVLSVTVSGTSKTVGDYTALPGGVLWSNNGVWTGPTSTNPLNVTVDYEHGYDHVRNGVDRIALDLLLHRLVPKTIPSNLLSWDGELGSQRFVLPGGPSRNPTGLPHVDQWIVENSRQLGVW